MTVLGALALDEGCRVLPLFEGSKRQRRGRHALIREWCEVGVCLRGVVMNHFIGRSRVDFFFHWACLQDLHSSRPMQNPPTTHSLIYGPSPNFPPHHTYCTLLTQVAGPNFRAHLLPAGRGLSFVVCNREGEQEGEMRLMTSLACDLK